jgi:5-methylcytosine-specific restriction endonuclease McrA
MQLSDPDWQTVWDMFHGRCVLCYEQGATVHEIIFRSSGKSAMQIDNRIVLCFNCHRDVHDKGYKVSVEQLREARKKALERYANRQE